MPATNKGAAINSTPMRRSLMSCAPFRPTLLEERADALSRLVAGARLGENARSYQAQLRRDRRLPDLAQQRLGPRERHRPALRKLLHDLFHAGIEPGRRHALVRETDAMRFTRREPLAGKNIAARLLLPHRSHDVRADHRGYQ